VLAAIEAVAEAGTERLAGRRDTDVAAEAGAG